MLPPTTTTTITTPTPTNTNKNTTARKFLHSNCNLGDYLCGHDTQRVASKTQPTSFDVLAKNQRRPRRFVRTSPELMP